MISAIVQTQNLCKHYGSFRALSDCNLEVNRGEIFGLLGPNGSGKTTLIRTLMGFLQPTSGRAEIGGLDCWQKSVAVHQEVSYLPGEARLFRRMNGRQVVEFLSSIHPRGDLDRALAMAKRLDVDLTRKVTACSTGMRQKVALSAILAARTPLVILDEPTANLDPGVRTEILELLKEQRAAGRTVLVSSHVFSETEEICDRCAFLKKGELVLTQDLHAMRQFHRIELNLRGPYSPPPETLAERVEILSQSEQKICMQTTGNLGPLLGWLGSLDVDQVHIEPIGLRAVYESIHGRGNA